MNDLNELISLLFLECIEKDLSFNYSGNVSQIEIYDFKYNKLVKIFEGYIKNWERDKPIDVVNEAIKKMEEYINE